MNHSTRHRWISEVKLKSKEDGLYIREPGATSRPSSTVILLFSNFPLLTSFLFHTAYILSGLDSLLHTVALHPVSACLHLLSFLKKKLCCCMNAAASETGNCSLFAQTINSRPPPYGSPHPGSSKSKVF